MENPIKKIDACVFSVAEGTGFDYRLDSETEKRKTDKDDTDV